MPLRSVLLLCPLLLTACTVTVGASSLLPDLPEPAGDRPAAPPAAPAPSPRAGDQPFAGREIAVDQASLFPALPDPDERRVTPLGGYVREERILTLPGLGDVHVARLARPGNRATVIYSGGNASFIATSGERLNRLAEITQGDIVTFDYPGRGGTTIANTPASFVGFGPALVAALRREGWIAEGALYAYGFSLGGAFAANMARSGGFDGIILEGTAPDIAAVVRNAVPPAMRPFIRVRISDDLKLYDYRGYVIEARAPVLVIAGEADETVDAELSRRFADDLAAQGLVVTFRQVPGGHGDGLDAESGRAAVQEFLAAATVRADR